MFKSIKTRLLFYFLAIGLLPVIAAGVASVLQSRDALRNQALDQLTSVRENKKAQLDGLLIEKQQDMLALLEIVSTFKQAAFRKLKSVQQNKKMQVEGYFNERLSEIGVLSQSKSVAEALKQFNTAFLKEERQTGGQAWRSIAKTFSAELTHFQEARGYHDLLLLNRQGDIVYSTRQAADMGQNAADGALKDSVLGRAFRQGLKAVNIQDYAPYAPQEDHYMAFLAAPVHRYGEILGVLALGLTHEPLNRIVQQREGMGETGETYLVGKAGGQTTYRSDRVVKKAAANTIGQPKKGGDVDKAMDGKSGVAMKLGSTNVFELGGYAPLNIPGLHWCVITTIALEEAITPRPVGGGADFFSQYIGIYGYYDLFLIHPGGDIFYTVAHEADYGASLYGDALKESELGKLFHEVVSGKTFGISDYAPYGPRGDAPAMFIALPLLTGDTIELVIALQMSEGVFNGIMQRHAGMGKSGETYLVGSDQLMRSDSFLDPDKHSVRASFANPKQGSVDTESSLAALEGESGAHETENYLGHQVLSAYTPVYTGTRTFALIAEISKAEAFTHIGPLQGLLAGIVVAVIMITAVSIGRFTKTLVSPLLSVNRHLRNLAQGRLSKEEITYRGKDEIGEIVMSFRQLRKSVKSTIKQANAIASGDYSHEVELLSEEDQLGKALAGMTATLREVIDQAHAIAAGDYSQKVNLLSDRDLLGQALSEMTRTLREITAKNVREGWLKTGLAQLSDDISGEQDVNQLAENVINFLTPYVGAQVGAFYMLEKKEGQAPHLRMSASHAYLWRKSAINTFELGEGIVGQAGYERKMFLITKTPEDYIHIHSGLGEAAPGTILVMPFLYEGALKGVIELASFETFGKEQIEFLKQAMPAVAIATNTAKSRAKMKVLLEQSQIQAEELRSQQENMQEANEQLQSQKEQLQGQAGELQAREEELRQTNEELRERTEALEEQQLEVRNKNAELEKSQAAIQAKAEEVELASKYKSEFFANMSHELRTPLNSLLILARLLADNKENTLTEKQVECAHTIYSAGSDLLALINEILDLSKAEAGKIEVHPDDLPLNDIVTSLEEKFRHVAEDKQVSFVIHQANDLPAHLRTDFQRLMQILNNLLSNAFKFTAQGEVSVNIRRASIGEDLSRSGLKPGEAIAFAVADTGIGIPPDKQKLIFEAFQQADGTTSRSYGGTGLGLSISRQLAQLLGGEIRLSSKDGEGSTFTLYLPEKLSGGAPPPPRKSETPPARKDRSSVAKTKAPAQVNITDDRENLKPEDKSILIVEDDRNFLQTLMNLAREKNFKCLVAEDGAAGLQLVEACKPNAVILDVGLPQVDGWTVMENLKKNLESRHIPVYFISGADQGADASKMGAIGYLLKPASMAELGEAFKKIEQFIAKNVKNLLIVTDNRQNEPVLSDLLGGGKVDLVLATTREDAWQNLQTAQFDCIVADLSAEKSIGIPLLEQLCNDNAAPRIPIIVYAGRDLTEQEEAVLQQCADSLTIKTVRSPECLLDETTLFLHQVESQLTQEQQKLLQLAHDKEATLAGKKILMVDDDSRNIFAMGAILEEKGMEFLMAPNGKKGLALLEEHPDIALVLMDIMMPRMDGYEAMRKIRAQKRFRKLPIIAFTAKAMKGNRAKCIEAGANDYMTKPIDTNKLVSLMRIWLYQ
ncbi:MAG: response regulator [Gammaproteobacteria bacterium]|nr:response regulator [Gammaproteobacteria bacterium]